ncbi:RlpA-like double-psi beta-barrel domain-containing protein [Fodinicola feengrottensis]|uniref:Uncharacterized protein n=1 Tax=Fodinicola feengrottensis TaxID=435914 RepID=A0ABN2FPM9_9ACTN|nr:hypothetical protein [Fodinicola feengrottensis]
MGCGTNQWSGEASWFCCGAGWGPCGDAGGGACGNCNSGSYQCAWPYASDSCFNITRPDICGESLPYKPCGSTIFVTHWCSGACVTVSVADCGPNTQMFCGEAVCCNGTCRTNRDCDLTPAAYSVIASLDTGLTPVMFGY